LPSLSPIPARIEDYALLSDCHAAALVSRGGSIDWLCWPRFDSAACFAALLGGEEQGRWQICPADPITAVNRAYRDGSPVMETIFETATGTVALIDFMPVNGNFSSILRIVEGRTGSVAMCLRLRLRFDYGSIVPWVTRLDAAHGHSLVAIAGPDLVVLHADVQTEGEDMQTVAAFTVEAGKSLRFQLSHGPSHLEPPPRLNASAELDRTETHWHDWSDRCSHEGEFAEAVKRSLITLKALTFAPTGGIVAAATTSLPELIGGSRNWDYRFCWLRDATLTLVALMDAGYYEEAQSWTDWLHRSVAGSANQVQIMYGIAGERRLDEWEVPWLPGYENSAPVRIGNQAAGQVQLDVFGEVMASMSQARRGGLVLPPAAWSLQCTLLSHLSEIWEQPDEGMWEVRGGRRQFTFSKIMAWRAFDCAISDAEQFNLEAPLDEWRTIRTKIHELVCAEGFHAGRGSFVQSFDSDRLDASLLQIPVMGFLPADDPRVLGTVAAIERDLMRDGLVMRYEPDKTIDGQAGSEGAFLACSFWLVNCMAVQGRTPEARALFKRLLALANDVGLMAEEYDPGAHRLVGNFPQAFSHLAMVTSATILRDASDATVKVRGVAPKPPFLVGA
jgi:GH15 family glucan-1,4-alpha-glucosidase